MSLFENTEDNTVVNVCDESSPKYCYTPSHQSIGFVGVVCELKTRNVFLRIRLYSIVLQILSVSCSNRVSHRRRTGLLLFCLPARRVATVTHSWNFAPIKCRVVYHPIE